MQSRSKEEISDFIVFKIIYPLLGIVFIAVNPISFFVLATLLSTIVYCLIFRKHIFRKTFLFVLAPVYIFLMFVYSVSPLIQYYEFKLTHHDWIEVKGQISNFDVVWKGGKSRKSTVDIDYQYTIYSKKFHSTAVDIINRRSHSVFWSSENEIKESNVKLKQDVAEYVSEMNFKIFHNLQTEESRLFIPLNILLFSNSSGFSIIYGMLKIILFPFLFFIIFSSIKNKFQN